MTIEEQHEHDDTLGHRKLAALLHMGKNRVKRVMHKYGIAAKRKRRRYAYPGRAAQVVPNLLQGKQEECVSEGLFSDIFEVSLADGFQLSMSRAGTPTETATLNALWASSSWQLLNAGPIIPWERFCKRLRSGSTSTIATALMKV